MITVTFSNGRQVVYTMAIFDLLKADNSVIEIMDNETGEILFYR